MDFFKSNLPHECKRLCKLRLRFPGKAGHHIRCHRCIREAAAQAAAKRLIFRAGVMPVHPAECFVAAALQGEVKLRAELFTVREPLHHLRGEVIRLQGAEAHAQNAADRAGKLYCVAEGEAEIFSIGGEIDPHEHDFRKACLPQAEQLFLQLVQRLGAHPAARGRDDAVGAEPVAAILNFHKSARMLLKAGDRPAMEALPGFMWAHMEDALAAELIFVDGLKNRFAVAVADDDIRLSERLCLLRIGLRHTAGEHNNALRMQPFEAPYRLTGFLVARAGHRAGIYKIKIRFLLRRDDFKALCPELLAQCLCFILIHLASKGIKCGFHKGDSHFRSK